MPPLDLDFKQGIKNCVECTIQPGSHKEITWVHTHTQYITRQLSWHVSSLLTHQAQPGNGFGAPGFHRYKGH